MATFHGCWDGTALFPHAEVLTLNFDWWEWKNVGPGKVWMSYFILPAIELNYSLIWYFYVSMTFQGCMTNVRSPHLTSAQGSRIPFAFDRWLWFNLELVTLSAVCNTRLTSCAYLLPYILILKVLHFFSYIPPPTAVHSTRICAATPGTMRLRRRM